MVWFGSDQRDTNRRPGFDQCFSFAGDVTREAAGASFILSSRVYPFLVNVSVRCAAEVLDWCDVIIGLRSQVGPLC
jgi:hypothetical protein